MKTVLCFGTFDLLHPGHGHYFAQAEKLGDKVVVVVARDRTVLDVKGQLPSMNEDARLQAVAAHPCVDEAYLGNHDDKYRIVEEIKPDVILLGYDQQAFTDKLEDELERRDIDAEIRRAEALEPERYKSSLLREDTMPRVVDGDEDELPI